MRACTPVLSFVLTRSLYTVVPGLQGTEAIRVPRFPNRRDVCAYGMCETFCFYAVIPLGLLLHSESHGAQGNHDHYSEPSRCRAVEVTGVEAVVTSIPKPTGRRTYGVCGTFHFCTVIPPLLTPALTDARDLGPLVSVWL
jgi:hypothetical protein